MNEYNDIVKDLKTEADPKRAETNAWFFKTKEGEYGYGDKFIGLTMPQQRAIAKRHKQASIPTILKLLRDPIHEFRMVALLLLAQHYKKGDEQKKREVVELFFKNTRYINNWDLVDVSTPYILGDWVLKHPKEKAILYEFARSKDLWEKRISILGTFNMIRGEKYKDTLEIAEILLKDTHDLIHKAVGWMLREVGKKDLDTLRAFLDIYAKMMPRTMLRYAIEKMSPEERKKYMTR